MTTRIPDIDCIHQQIETANAFLDLARDYIDEYMLPYRGLEIIASYAAGDQTKQFAALRVLVANFGRQMTFLILQLAANESNQKWRLILRPRKVSERPNHGRDFRKESALAVVERIGVAYYRERKAGTGHHEAVNCVRTKLRLNLSDSSFRQKLQQFRCEVKRRGYVDRTAPVFSRALSSRSVPELLVSDVIKRGRPRK